MGVCVCVLHDARTQCKYISEMNHVHDRNIYRMYTMLYERAIVLTWNVHKKNVSLKFKTNNQTCIEHLMNAVHLKIVAPPYQTARNGSCTRNILFKSATNSTYTFLLHCIALLECRCIGRTNGREVGMRLATQLFHFNCAILCWCT